MSKVALTNSSNFRKNIKSYIDLATEEDTTVFVLCKKGTIVVLSQEEYNRITQTVNIPLK